MTKLLRILFILMLITIACISPAQEYHLTGGGLNRIADIIDSASAVGGTIYLNDNAIYTETRPLYVGLRYDGNSRRSFNIEATVGTTPTLVLSGAQLVMYAGSRNVQIGSSTGGRILIDGTNAAEPVVWYIGQENGLTSTLACQAALENLDIHLGARNEGIVFGAGGNDANPQTFGASLTLRRVKIEGGYYPVSQLYSPSSYASSLNLEECAILEFQRTAVEVGRYGLGGANTQCQISRCIFYNSPSTSGVDSNSLVCRLGQTSVDHSDIINEANGVSRAVVLLSSGNCSITNSILHGDAGSVNWGTGTATINDSNVTARSVSNVAFSWTNVIEEWSPYVDYGLDLSDPDMFRVSSTSQSDSHGSSPPLGSGLTFPASPVPTPTVTPTPTPVPNLQQNGYISVALVDDKIVTLRFDATGEGNYGPETVASPEGIREVASVTLNGNLLTLQPKAGRILWDLPFVQAGYYDADANLNYPNARNTLGATPLLLPFRAFVGSSGQVSRIEHFKRLPDGRYFLWLNISDGSRLLMQSDLSLNYDLETTWPGRDSLTYLVAADRLTFEASPIMGALRIEVLEQGIRSIPHDARKLPSASFVPDATITYEPTGKKISLSQLMTEMLQQGIYWSPSITAGGEWVLGSLETHLFVDPRIWYARQLRRDLLQYLGNIGYDRFEHFGHLYAWGRYPDYGAPGLLNVPPGNAPYDMRMLHLNGMWIHSLARYILATGDLDFLQAKRARWVATNGAEPQPLCGGGATTFDYVLSSGDVRLDGQPSTARHSLGQEFTATVPFTRVRARIGNPSMTETNLGKLILYDKRGGTELGQQTFSIPLNQTQEIAITLAGSLPPGKYYLELTDDDSGVRYFGPGVIWWTEVESRYSGGDAYSGPMKATVADSLQVLFSYMRDYMGAASENLIYYQNHPEYNIPNHRSGRHAVGTTTSFWEAAGGGYDAYVAIWYNTACTAMAEMAQLAGNATQAAEYQALRSLADQAYNDRFWRTFTDNGIPFSRYHACQDWDQVIRDYGFTYYNLEAASRKISSPAQSRAILWWLDRGFWSNTGGASWNPDIYSLWEIAPPFNTRSNNTWYNVTGTLPYLEVVSNGGARLDATARDLHLRSQVLSIDNMHERNLRALSRYASPDRLTGGRTFDDPGGRGRWQFLGPSNNRLDFEGFREIFPSSGLFASHQPVAYLGLEHTAQGLRLAPRLPSSHSEIRFNHLAYWNTIFNFSIQAERITRLAMTESPHAYLLATTGSVGQTFTVTDSFNKAGLRVSVAPFQRKANNRLSVVLEQQAGEDWLEAGVNWYSHIQDQQWVWVSVNQILGPGHYRVRIHQVQPAPGETISISYHAEDQLPEGEAFQQGYALPLSGDLALQVLLERTLLTVDSIYNPEEKSFTLQGARSGVLRSNLGDGIIRLQCSLDPDEKVFLTTDTPLDVANWTVY